MEQAFELTTEQMEKAAGGMQPDNLQFTGKSAKAQSTVQKGAAPKDGGLVHKEAHSTAGQNTR